MQNNNANSAEFEDYKDRITSFSNEFDLGLFLYILKKSAVWIILMLTLSITAAFIYLRYTHPEYKSEALIQFNEKDAGDKVLQVNRPFEEEGGLQVKIELIKSKFFLERVIDKLPLDVRYFAKGEFLTSEHYSFSKYYIEIINKPKESDFFDKPIFIEFFPDGDIVLSNKTGFEKKAKVGQIFNLNGFTVRVITEDLPALIDLKDSSPLYFIFPSKTSLVKELKDNLSAAVQNPIAKTIKISYVSRSAQLAYDVINEITNQYNDFELETKRESANNILNFIDNQLDTVFFNLRRSEYKLQEFKRDNRVVRVTGLSDAFIGKISDFETKLNELDFEETLLKQITLISSNDSVAFEVYDLIPLLVGTEYEGTLSKLIENLQDLLVRRESIGFKSTIEAPAIRSLNYQIDIQKKLILESVESLLEKLGRQRELLKSKIDQLETGLYSIPPKELEYASLEREFAIHEKYYTMLLEKKIQYRISEAGYVVDNQILEPPSKNMTPISPNRNLIGVGSLILGVILGLILVVIRYLLHDTISSLKEITKISNASIGILGIVPKSKYEMANSILLVDKKPKSIMAEAFRSIRTDLQFISNKPGPKLIGVTSTVSGEGKTFVAVNLGGIIAFSNKKTVIIDLDLRKPKIHKAFNVGNTKGMSTILIGKSTIEECLIKHPTMDDLYLIPSGPTPPNPAELIASEKMDEILGLLKEKFDYIIADNPPVGLVTDGINIIRKADYPIYVFRADYSKKAYIQNVDRLIFENGITKLSAVLNSVDIERSKYGYGNQSYGYGYGYGYSYGNTYGNGYYTEGENNEKSGFFNSLFKRWSK
ncbi:MAG: GumC family protein [Luteibaculaceae bacterium]